MAFVLGFAPAASVKAESDAKARNADVLRKILEAVRSKEDVLGLLAKIRSSSESLMAIEWDLQRRNPKKLDKTKMTIVEDQIQVDGKPTGMKITSYSPLKLKFNGKKWLFNRDKTPDANYESLAQFIEKNETQESKGETAMSLLFPKAHAISMNTPLKGFLMLGGLGLLAGALIGYATGESMMGLALAGLLGLGGIGLMIGSMNQQQEQMEAAKKAAAAQAALPVWQSANAKINVGPPVVGRTAAKPILPTLTQPVFQPPPPVRMPAATRSAPRAAQ